MTSPNITDVPVSAQLTWERLMAKTRYGRYADDIENQIVSFAFNKHTTPGRLLDIGCEGGRRSKPFADCGWQVIALDIDERALKVCRQRIPNAICTLVRPEQQQHFPVLDEYVDLALCIEVGPVIHQKWAAAEFARILKSGGRVAGVCWNRASWRGFLYHSSPSLRITGSNPLVGYPITYRSFRQHMIKNGFQFEKELGYAWGPFRRNSNSRIIELWANLERYSGLRRFISLSPMVAFVCLKT